METPARPDVLILGSGALASLFAARLSRGGRRVAIAGTWRPALETVRARGIVVEEGREAWSAPALVLDRSGPLPVSPFVLVMVKSYQTSAVAGAARRAVTPEGLIVTFQNGRGNREALAAAAGRGRVALGVTTAGATLLGPGRVRAFPGRAVIGREVAPEAVQTLAGLLTAAALPTRAVDDVERHAWRKLAVNCAINPLSALAGVTNGALASDALWRVRMAAAAREVGAIAAGRGVPLEEDPAETAFSVARATAGNRSSMLQDLDRGAPTEIDALCGAVVREGQALGVATPANERLWREVLEREGGRRLPGRAG